MKGSKEHSLLANFRGTKRQLNVKEKRKRQIKGGGGGMEIELSQ